MVIGDSSTGDDRRDGADRRAPAALRPGPDPHPPASTRPSHTIRRMRLRRFRRPFADYLLLVEATFSMAAGWLRLHTRPFRELTAWMARPFDRPEPAEEVRLVAVRRVSWAIRRLAERGPLPFVCFPQAIAAMSMLRRRGIPVALYYGVARSDEKGLQAHVWVKDGEVPVVGCRAAVGFTVLHIFAPEGARRAEAGR
ncbi:MAG: lasso peptide biosynthesis B2 protein [Alphaproteobacteria bacterium]